MMGKEKAERRKEKEPCGMNSPDGALPLFIGGGDRLGGEGVQENILHIPKYKRLIIMSSRLYSHPLTSKAGPLPL